MVHSTIIDYAFEPTVPERTRESMAVAVVRIGAVGSGRWNTATGAPPADLEHQDTPVIRLVRLDVERIVAGRALPASFVVWTLGGTIGCHEWWVTGSPRRLAPGDRFAVFLGGQQPAIQLANLRSVSAWLPIDANGHLQADGRDLTIDDLSALARTGH